MKYLIVFSLCLLASCTTLKRCERKFSTILTDTVIVKKQIVVNVPKDSAVLRIKTDTTTIYKEIHQGRATVRIIREPTFTTVYATCDSLRIVKEAIAKIPQKVIKMGVSHFYKYAFFIVLAALALLCAALYLSRIWTIQITKK